MKHQSINALDTSRGTPYRSGAIQPHGSDLQGGHRGRRLGGVLVPARAPTDEREDTSIRVRENCHDATVRSRGSDRFPRARRDTGRLGPNGRHDPRAAAARQGRFRELLQPAVQAKFERAVAMLHSFWYAAAEKAFREVLQEDPRAHRHLGHRVDPDVQPARRQRRLAQGRGAAQAAIDEGRRDRREDRARARLHRGGRRVLRGFRRPLRARAAGSRAPRPSRRWPRSYPKDDEAQIFSALYLAGTQSQADQTYAAYLKAAAILEKQFAKHPDHPGVAHYLIHSYDAPPIAAEGPDRRAALREHRAGGAARAAHAVAHLHARRRVGGVDRRPTGARRRWRRTASEPDEALHAMDYMVYALPAARARRRRARSVDEAMKVQGLEPGAFAGPYAIAAMPARYAVERGAWREAAQLRAAAEQVSRSPRRSRTSRARSARRAAATPPPRRRMPRARARCTRRCKAAKNNYWATEVEVQRLAAAAWIALRAGQARRSARAHARRRRPRGQEREAHRHAGPHRSRARAARRHAARAEAPRGRSRSSRRRSSASPTASAASTARRWPRAGGRARPRRRSTSGGWSKWPGPAVLGRRSSTHEHT